LCFTLRPENVNGVQQVNGREGKKNGNKNVFYTEYENTNHNGVFLKAFTEPKLYQWLAKQKLK